MLLGGSVNVNVLFPPPPRTFLAFASRDSSYEPRLTFNTVRRIKGYPGIKGSGGGRGGGEARGRKDFSVIPFVKTRGALRTRVSFFHAAARAFSATLADYALATWLNSR